MTSETHVVSIEDLPDGRAKVVIDFSDADAELIARAMGVEVLDEEAASRFVTEALTHFIRENSVLESG